MVVMFGKALGLPPERSSTARLGQIVSVAHAVCRGDGSTISACPIDRNGPGAVRLSNYRKQGWKLRIMIDELRMEVVEGGSIESDINGKRPVSQGDSRTGGPFRELRRPC